jgi:hypothetical protein
MASPRSVDSEIDTNDTSISSHIKQLVQAIDVTVKVAKFIGEARGNGTLKPGKKVKFDNDTMLGIEDLNSYVSSIKNGLKRIPKMINDEKKAEKAAARARRGAHPVKAQPPGQYKAPLVNFFNQTDMGNGPDGRRLQDNSEMELFFKYGVGIPTFGVSLFNVWGNVQKLKTGKSQVVLDAKSREILHEALTELKNTRRDTLAKGGLDEAAMNGIRQDIERLESGQLKNKDYMFIFCFYRNKENTTDLSAHAPGVANMSRITKELNSQYGAKVKAATETAAPATMALPMPVAPAKPALPTPAVSTVNTRGPSPVVARRR